MSASPTRTALVESTSPLAQTYSNISNSEHIRSAKLSVEIGMSKDEIYNPLWLEYMPGLEALVNGGIVDALEKF
ncbi:hypothetical protein N7537_010326 [Penicillium hordei]|uniref:Uncharacterized protein n=1 Tax=Penicillium hordei TaxID=40994 RepID=A0AAD6DUK8_9EURO|nr:uncharacterized protein N7537_010326 [Penicillium hordei]KAJ5593422.1 hypothetical protein N7537_010326 [Penicillium hordei]